MIELSQEALLAACIVSLCEKIGLKVVEKINNENKNK